jgi:hypothetical protein
MAQVGRNDPCPCGSGNKYKRCCMARDKAEQAERMAWEHAALDMRRALIGFAKEKDFLKDLAAGMGLFWQDRYTADTVHLMSVDESLRFFDWFAHDYRLQDWGASETGETVVGERLIEVYRDRMADVLSDKEAQVLDDWIGSLPGSAFALEGVDPERGTIELRDLFLPDRALTVEDTAAASHGEVGQILLARPLPEQGRWRLSGATVVVPAAEEEGLRAFLEGAYRAYLEEASDPGLNQGTERMDGLGDASLRARFLRDRASLLTHYALDWAEREGRPAVSAQDPDAQKPGSSAVQKLVRWGQARVQVR